MGDLLHCIRDRQPLPVKPEHARAAVHYTALAADALRAASYCQHTAPSDAIETLVYLRNVEMDGRFTVDDEGYVTLWAVSLNKTWVMPSLWLTDAEIDEACDQFRECED